MENNQNLDIILNSTSFLEMNILIKNNKNKILNCITFDEAINIFKKDIWGTKNRFVFF